MVARLQDQQQYIQDLRSMLEYQVSVQVGRMIEILIISQAIMNKVCQRTFAKFHAQACY